MFVEFTKDEIVFPTISEVFGEISKDTANKTHHDFIKMEDT